MTAQVELFHVPVGRTKSGRRIILCASGLAKVQEHDAKIQYKKAEGEVTVFSPRIGTHIQKNRLIRKPYIFARFIDPDTGRTIRPELGRWLLDTQLPVTHRNGDPADFTLPNLEARESERQKKRRIVAQAKREVREKKAAERAAKLALKPQKPPDGLTPDEQLAVLFDEQFQAKLTRMASAIIRDPLQKGTPKKPTDEKRGPEVVSMVVDSAIQPVRNGQVRNVRAYIYRAVLTQAIKERAMRWYGMGHVRRPKAESHTLSDIETRKKEEYA